MSVLDIAIENNVASGAILRRARQEGWERAAASVTKRHVQTSTDNESRRMNSRDDVPELDVEGLALEPEKPPRLSIDLDDL